MIPAKLSKLFSYSTLQPITKRHFMPYKIGLLLVVIVLQGCAASNSITQLTCGEQTTALASDGRYENLFPNVPDYPVTREKECYPEHANVQCNELGCRYTGDKPTGNLAGQFSIQWLGHASFWITANDGQTFLLDPVTDEFDWPVNWAFELTGGHTRQPPNWQLNDTIDNVDAVLYSHLHYDHFNK